MLYSVKMLLISGALLVSVSIGFLSNSVGYGFLSAGVALVIGGLFKYIDDGINS